MISNYSLKSAACITCILVVTACGGSSENGNNDPAILTGVLKDGVVEGVRFVTQSQSGLTSSQGEFTYQSGEQVTFFIGDLAFPSIEATPLITPVELAAGAVNSNDAIINIAKLLQSLDEDGNADNGIKIPDSAAASATLLNFDQSIAQFEQNADVINLVANSGSATTTLISSELAISHLNSSLGSSISLLGENPGDANVVTNGRIATLEQFTATLIGKTVVRLNDDATRDETTRLVSTADMKTTGTFNGESIDLDWYWEDEYYCRSGQSTSVIVELQCQTVIIGEGVVTFTDDRGAGDSRSYFIED